MGSLERSKKRAQLWKKAMIHFSLCFVMGFFTGFAPTGKSSIFPSHAATSNTSEIALQPVQVPQNVDRSSKASPMPAAVPERRGVPQHSKLHLRAEAKLKPKRLIIIVTPISTKLAFQEVHLRRLANTIRLVSQPLLWIVVEAQRDSNEVSEILRKTGIMYRHLVFKENFTDLEGELNHERNLALKHIEHHRLSGIVHFAGLSNVYDLEFFNHLRTIEVFGTWPMAMVAANRKKVRIEGPVCDSSRVIAWRLRNNKLNMKTDTAPTPTPAIHISSFAFNSSILWDPERWGRTSSVQDTSQNTIKFLKQVVLEDETQLKGFPAEDCSRILLWHVKFHARTAPRYKLLTAPSGVNKI